MSTAHRPPRVLLVEDDGIVAEGLGMGLRRAGYEVSILGNGVAFAQIIDAFRPDLALLDVTLPGGPDGFALATPRRGRSQDSV